MEAAMVKGEAGSTSAYTPTLVSQMGPLDMQKSFLKHIHIVESPSESIIWTTDWPEL